jgi:hypothetical protein
MTMFGSQWLANAGASYEIDQSIRFNDNDSPRLYRTVGTATSRKTMTFSWWMKRGNITLGAEAKLFAANGSNDDQIAIETGAPDTIRFYLAGTTAAKFRPNAVLRDPSAWYHIVIALDTTQSTSTDRVKIYYNGVQQTDFAEETYPSLNYQTLGFNYTGAALGIGHRAWASPASFFDGYFAEINFIDGTAAAPTAFGEFNDDGVWIPKAYSGAYGDQGYYITGATAGDLGEDFSGNNNDFTSAGLTTADQMLDTPTLNYPTLNSAVIYQSGLLLSDGNLDAFGSSGSGWNLIPATMQIPSTGKWAFECTILSSGYIMIGFASAKDINNFQGSGKYFSLMQNAGWLYNTETNKRVNGSNTNSGGLAGLTTNDVVECMIDNDAGTMTFLKNGSAYASLSGLNPLEQPAIAVYTNGAYRAKVDFGQIDYVPSDSSYSAINSSTLPTATVTDGSKYFQSTLYEGNGSTQSIDQDGNSTFQPDWVWIKNRDATDAHALFDAVRGVTKVISSDATTTEATNDDTLTGFESDGFALGDDVIVNTNNESYVGWQWKANGSGSSNTDGSINSTVSANTTAGFSIVKYTGNATVGATVGHGLGVVPKMFVVKPLGAAEGWAVYHEAMGNTKAMYWNLAATPNTGSYYWNNTTPTSSVFTLSNHVLNNGSGNIMIAYCFAEIPGYSSFGSYEGNSNADGQFVYTGFKPSFIMTKNMDTADQWGIRDTARNPFNITDKLLNPNAATAETSAASGYIDILSNGFKARSADSNINTQSMLYMAFAENPFGGEDIAPATAR